jgi:viroplasmin and RNaseH domain-containing protein
MQNKVEPFVPKRERSKQLNIRLNEKELELLQAIKDGIGTKDTIVTTWAKWKKLVLGYNAVYKSFTTEEEAKNYLGTVNSKKVKEQTIFGIEKKNGMIEEVFSQELARLTLNLQQETKNLIKKSEKEISTLSDNFGKILSNLNTKIEDTYNKNTKRITEETTSTVQKCQELQESSKKRFNSYYNRKKIIDWIVFINLGITPIFLILLFFIKK